MNVITDSCRVIGITTDVSFCSNFLPLDYADQLYAYLLTYAKWGKDPNTLKNRRTNVSYGDPRLKYELKFHGKNITRSVLPWSDLPGLLELKTKIEESSGQKYNYVVIQLYPNPKVGIKPHRDKEMVPGTTIAGISLGATRLLTISHSYMKQVFQFQLTHGSVYLLNPPTNDFNTHCIPPGTELNTDGIRISLTFRLLP